MSGTCCEVDCHGGQVTKSQAPATQIRRDGGNANSTTRGTDRRWAIGSNHCAIRIMEQIAQSKRIQSHLGTSLCRDSPDSTLESRIQCPPLQGQAIRSQHPKQHNGMPIPTPNNADSGHRRLTGLDLRNPLENDSEAANRYPPLLGRGRSFGSFAARLGIRLPRPPRSETKLFRPWMLRVRDPAAAPCWLLGASPLLCRGRNRGARSLNAQWWARSCDRSDVGRLARPMGRGEVVLRGHASGHQRMRLHDGACSPMIWPSR